MSDHSKLFLFVFQYVKNWKLFVKMVERNVAERKVDTRKNLFLKFLVLRGTKEELFAYIFGVYFKFGYKNLLDLVHVASYLELLVVKPEGTV